MIRTQIQLDPAQAAALRRLSAERHVSMAELIRQAIDRMINEVGRKSRRQRTLSVVGAFAGGPSKVSEDHDEALAEAFLP